MWIVRTALDRPYTFVVLALLILILSPLVILATPTDIFPNINIPVVAVGWTYTGLAPEEMEGRITTVYERSLTTLVDNIQHIESTSYNGLSIVKIYLQPNSSIDTANAQVTAASQMLLRQLPPGTQPPLVINYSASSVPILQLGLSGEGMSEQALNDLGLNFLRTQLVTVPGSVIPYTYGGKQRQVMINLNPKLLQSKGLSPSDVLNSAAMQYLVLPSGTAKISQFEYDVRMNATPRTVRQLNDLAIFIPGFLFCCVSVFLLVPFLGQDFFPATDSGQFILHMRAKTGTRIEETARLADLVEDDIRKIIPASDMDTILDNIGLPYSTINLAHTASGVIGAADADIMVSLKSGHRPTAEYVNAIRAELAAKFPGVTFYSLPADMVTQVLNFGLPAPIDVQIDGADVNANRAVANRILDQIRAVPGIVDARVQQNFDYPDLEVNVDRTKAQQNGLTERDVATSVLATLSGSFQTAPMFFLNQQNGVSYNLAAQAPQYDIQSLRDLQTIPVTGSTEKAPAILADLATIKRSQEMASVDHYNIRRVVDVFANVQGRDLGAAGRDVTRIVDANRHLLPRGSFVTIRGQLETMRGAYINLLTGLGFSIVLVYLLIVVNFQSWLDPFIIITALPAALAGIVLCLFFTGTTLSVPALMGAIMCMGVATANSILMVSFARERLAAHGDSTRAAIEAGFTRFRPVLMTSLAMIIGMVPMALGLGEGGEQNAPLGRAVIGGLMLATVATLIFVPTVFSLLHRRRRTSGDPINAV